MTPTKEAASAWPGGAGVEAPTPAPSPAPSRPTLAIAGAVVFVIALVLTPLILQGWGQSSCGRFSLGCLVNAFLFFVAGQAVAALLLWLGLARLRPSAWRWLTLTLAVLSSLLLAGALITLLVAFS